MPSSPSGVFACIPMLATVPGEELYEGLAELNNLRATMLTYTPTAYDIENRILYDRAFLSDVVN